MTVTVEIPEDVEASLNLEAQARGLALPEFLAACLTDASDDIQACQIAEDRLNEPMAPISGSELRQRLGLPS